MEKNKKIVLICIIAVLSIMLICYVVFDIDIITIIENKVNARPEFTNIRWVEVEDTSEFIIFREDGTFAAGNMISGNPSYNADICERYKYNANKQEITILCGEYDRESTKIKVIDYNKKKGILKLRAYETIIEYEIYS